MPESIDGPSDADGTEQSATLEYRPGKAHFPGEADEVLAWMEGSWKLDPAICELPSAVIDSLKQSDPVTMTVGAAGAFTISAPRVVVASPAGEFVADFAFAGKLRIDGKLDTDKHIAMAIDEFRITHRNLDTSGLNLPFGAGFLANTIFDLFTAKLPSDTVLGLGAEGSHETVQMISGEYRTGLTREAASSTATVNMKMRRHVDARVEQATFIGRHGEMRKLTGTERYRDPGVLLEAPEWKHGQAEVGVSYSRAKRVKLEVVVTVKPAGRPFKLFGIDEEHPSLNFESSEQISTGLPQKITFSGKAKLPEWPIMLESNIVWNVLMSDDEQWYNAGEVKGLTVFVTWAQPILKTSHHADHLAYFTLNHRTPKRMKFAMKALDGSKKTVGEIATAIKNEVNSFSNPNNPENEFPLKLGEPSDIDPWRADVAWGLLDDDNTHHGNCGEATTIMEMMLRMIGIRATQTHVFASSKIEVLKKGDNVRRNIEVGGTEGSGEETRYCEHHKMHETLMMSFRPAGKDGDLQNLMLNHGEGCVEVEGVLYGGLVKGIYRPSPDRLASHNCLLELQEMAENPAKRTRNLTVRFQVWIPEKDIDRKGGNSFCAFADPKVYPDPKLNVVSDPAGIAVPI